MKFRVGDKVRIRSDLVVAKWYGGCQVTLNMASCCGDTVTLTEFFEYKCRYTVEENAYYWTDEMLEPVEEFNVGDVVYTEDVNRPLTILRKAWVVCYQDTTAHEYFVDERHLSKTKPLQKTTREELADKDLVLVDSRWN